MSLGRATPTMMDLAAIRLDEVEADRQPGVFRHARSLRGRLARIFPGPGPSPAAVPDAEPDHFVWHALDDLLPPQR